MSATTPHAEDPGRSSSPVESCGVFIQGPVVWRSSPHHVVTEGKSWNAGVRVPRLSGIHALSYSPSCSQAELMTVRVLARTVRIVTASSIKVLTHIFIRPPSSSSSGRLILGLAG